jgi:hypothetical protein
MKEGADKYRRDFKDAPHWEMLASERGITLPQWWVAPTPQKLRRYFRMTGPHGKWSDVYGISPAQLIERNPDWPLRAFVGVMLEG